LYQGLNCLGYSRIVEVCLFCIDGLLGYSRIVEVRLFGIDG